MENEVYVSRIQNRSPKNNGHKKEAEARRPREDSHFIPNCAKTDQVDHLSDQCIKTQEANLFVSLPYPGSHRLSVVRET